MVTGRYSAGVAGSPVLGIKMVLAFFQSRGVVLDMNRAVYRIDSASGPTSFRCRRGAPSGPVAASLAFLRAADTSSLLITLSSSGRVGLGFSTGRSSGGIAFRIVPSRTCRAPHLCGGELAPCRGFAPHVHPGGKIR